MSARDEILAAIRTALADVPAEESSDAFPVPREYQDTHISPDPAAMVDLLAENLADYRAHVHRCTREELPDTLAALLADHGTAAAAVPAGLPAEWLARCADVRLVPDTPDLAAGDLDAIDTVVTGCALAVAETGTIVLDAGPGQGRRVLSLIPDHHVCVVHVPDQVVASVGQALARLDPARPQTWISGPSATSDIELDRVEGVHGPRVLDVVLVGG